MNGHGNKVQNKGGQEIMDTMVSIDRPLGPSLGNVFGIGVSRLADVIERHENPQSQIQSWKEGEASGWNNPGNIKWPNTKKAQDYYTKQFGATKSKPTRTGSVFLNFPSYQMGRKALEDRLQTWSRGHSKIYKQNMTPYQFLKTYVIGPAAKESEYSDISGFANYLKSLEYEISKGGM